MSKEIKYLKIGDNFRLSRNDKYNLLLEEYGDTIDRKTKKVVGQDWKFFGYYGTIQQALKSIVKRQLLVDVESVNYLDDYVKAVEEQNEEVYKAIQTINESYL